uniref:Uncharacterized protein n=1 Tax=Setaria italica TaxID=4555 RepID=K4AH17_SETIT
MLLWRAQAGHCLAGAGLRRPRARGTQASARAECKTARPLRLGDRSVTHGCAGITGSQALFAVAGVGPSPRTTHMLDEIPQQNTQLWVPHCHKIYKDKRAFGVH